MIPQTIIYSDLNYQFITNTQGDIAIAYNADAVAGALMNILGTNRGERVMLPQFGANLKGMLFRLMDPNFAKILSNQIKTQIETWDPRITIVSVIFNQDAPNLAMYMTVNFAIKGLSGVQTITQPVS